MMTEEIWKAVPEYKGLYEVSNFGNVRSVDRNLHQISKWNGTYHRKYKGSILKKINRKNGYQSVTLSKNNKAKSFLVHRLVAMTFIERPNGYDYVNHKNEIKTDNRVENLEWVTFVENIRYGTGIKRGHSNRDKSWFHEHSGANNPNAKAIIQLTKAGEYVRSWGSVKEAASALGTTSTTICSALRGKNHTAKGFRWQYK